MKCRILIVFLLGSVSATWALPFTHYVAESLRLRSSGNATAPIVTVLQPFVGLEILEHGESAKIDGISADWVKVHTDSGFVGWCFSGYLKSLETNVADSIGRYIAGRKAGEYPKDTSSSSFENLSSIDEVKGQTGYYVQQLPRCFQGSGHAPEILQLSVLGGRLLVKEIDVQDGNNVVRLESEFKYDGTTFCHKNSKIKKQNGKIVVFYRENKPDKEWAGTWEYDDPYFFVSDLDTPLPASIKRLTTDYLQNFTGKYVFDSYSILNASNTEVNTKDFRSAVVRIKYDVEKKSLAVPCHDLLDITEPGNRVGEYTLYFVETLPSEPFFWMYGEGDGFVEERYWFFKGGIAISCEYNGFDFDKDGNETKTKYGKFVIFLKKVE